MSISKIMTDPKVRDAYLAIEASRAPIQLADEYLQAKLAGRAWECTALEEHIRDLARMHFMRDDVRDALSAMERHKARRKPGKGGSRMLKDIGARIRKHYAAGAFEKEKDLEQLTGRVIFRIPTGVNAFIKITCKDLPGAVELVACKYERGYKR